MYQYVHSNWRCEINYLRQNEKQFIDEILEKANENKITENITKKSCQKKYI